MISQHKCYRTFRAAYGGDEDKTISKQDPPAAVFDILP